MSLTLKKKMEDMHTKGRQQMQITLEALTIKLFTVFHTNTTATYIPLANIFYRYILRKIIKNSNGKN